MSRRRNTGLARATASSVLLRIAAGVLLVLAPVAVQARTEGQAETATQAVAPSADPASVAADASDTLQAVAVSSFRGQGSLPVLASRDLAVAQPDIVRAVITIHGRDRNADTYDRIAREALAKAGAAGAGTLLVTPRFADDGDPGLTANTLRWHGNDWMSGGLAAAPAAIGSFEALDAVLTRLSDRALFPHLRTVVLVGHSGGGQLVQRYAVLGHMPPALTARGMQVRFVVANPSSYSYFTDDRPTASGGFAPFPLDQCHRFDDWKYGMQDLPDYAEGATAEALESAYVQRDVTYLLGAADTDPSLGALDKSCAAEAQGATHLQRGQDFFRYLHLRHPVGLNQYEYEIAGVGHDATAMLTSDCALATIYDAPVCGHVLPPVTTQTAPAASVPPVARLLPPPPPPHRIVRRLPPPMPRHRPVERRLPQAAGWDWQPGDWDWNGDAYVWVPGHRVRRAVVPAAFVPPGWQFDGVGWVWVPGHWRAGR